jgi:hypothetical protein
LGGIGLLFPVGTPRGILPFSGRHGAGSPGDRHGVFLIRRFEATPVLSDPISNQFNRATQSIVLFLR